MMEDVINEEERAPEPALEVRNLVMSGVDSYTCEVNHTELGWISYTVIPGDVEDLGIRLYAAITAGEFGEPAPYVAPVKTREEVELLRRAAYANPITGSDRLFAEEKRMRVMGETGNEEVLQAAVTRYLEIQAEYPWPEA